jgi:flavodoxin
MRVLVVYESMFGNTAAIAGAISAGLKIETHATVELFEVGRAPLQIDSAVDLVVIGGPTHAFGMSRPETREAASEVSAPLVSPGPGIREWITTVTAPAGMTFAVFCTKVRGPLPGSAAKSAARELTERGWRQVAAPMTFHVHGKLGPLVDGEERRATGWGQTIAAACQAEMTSGRRS